MLCWRAICVCVVAGLHCVVRAASFCFLESAGDAGCLPAMRAVSPGPSLRSEAFEFVSVWALLLRTYIHASIHTCIHTSRVGATPGQPEISGGAPPRPGVAAGCQPGRVQEQRAMSALLLLLVGSLAAVPALEVQC